MALDALKAQRLYDKSLIIITSDHGEEFWEHDGIGHGHTLYNELLWVPLIIKLPDSIGRVGRINTTVSTLSILPTVLELCGIDSNGINADSLSPLWREDPLNFETKPIFSFTDDSSTNFDFILQSILFEQIKYIRHKATGSEEMFDLNRDPGEQFSLIQVTPEKAEFARKLLAEFNKRVSQWRARLLMTGPERIEPDGQIRRQLRALGYIN